MSNPLKNLADSEELKKLARPPAPLVEDEGKVLTVGIDGEGNPFYFLAEPTGGGGSTAWDDITGKPSEFEPTEHTHEISDITGLAAALAVCAPADALSTAQTTGTVDFTSSNIVRINASSNLTITLSGGVSPRAYEILITAVSADRTITFPANQAYDYETRVVQITAGKTRIISARLIDTVWRISFGAEGAVVA